MLFIFTSSLLDTHSYHVIAKRTGNWHLLLISPSKHANIFTPHCWNHTTCSLSWLQVVGKSNFAPPKPVPKLMIVSPPVLKSINLTSNRYRGYETRTLPHISAIKWKNGRDWGILARCEGTPKGTEACKPTAPSMLGLDAGIGWLSLR